MKVVIISAIIATGVLAFIGLIILIASARKLDSFERKKIY